MEKRIPGQESVDRCRAVLKRGLEINSDSACIVQAWGLLELQQGNLRPAVMMLERAVELQPEACSPVLRWQQVEAARRIVASRLSKRRKAGIVFKGQRACLLPPAV